MHELAYGIVNCFGSEEFLHIYATLCINPPCCSCDFIARKTCRKELASGKSDSCCTYYPGCIHSDIQNMHHDLPLMMDSCMFCILSSNVYSYSAKFIFLANSQSKLQCLKVFKTIPSCDSFLESQVARKLVQKLFFLRELVVSSGS